jgi:hypothetical protein
MKRRWIVGLALAALAGVWFCSRGGSNNPDDVQALLDSGEIGLTISQSGPTQIEIKVDRLNDSDQPIHAVIPAGKVVYPASDDRQQMIIAVPVEIDLTVGEVSQDYTVEAYCLDQFLPSTPLGNALSYSRPGANGAEESVQLVTDSGVNIGELTPCLNEQGGSHAQIQSALWLVEGDYLDLAPDQAESEMETKYAQKLDDEVRQGLRSDYRDKVLARLPNATTEQVDNALDDYIDNELTSELSGKAAEMAQHNLKGMLDPRVREMLKSCGVDTVDKAFFA